MKKQNNYKTNYKCDEHIKKSDVFSYTPFDYCEKYGYTAIVRNYLKDVYELAQYLLIVLKTIKICKEDESTFYHYITIEK